MLPNIKFDVIGMKLSELSPFESPFIFRQKSALQAGSVQGGQEWGTGRQNRAK